MSRVKLVQKPEDFAAIGGAPSTPDLDNLFDHMFAVSQKREIGDAAKVFAVVARDPKLALLLINVSDYMTQKFPWTTDRRDLRELMIQTLNWHFQADYNFQAHIPSGKRVGISAEMQAALPYWKISSIFNDEQRLVIEYTLMASAGTVSAELFDRVSAHFGEQGAFEFTASVAWWSMWAIICSAVQPVHDFGHGSPVVAA